MKPSYYNHYIKDENAVILYNAFSDSYLFFKTDIFNHFESNIDTLSIFQQNFPKQYETLYNNGFIVADGSNEKNVFQNFYYERKFSRTNYQLIINPTLNCNLACWYCYENHVEKSTMSKELITKTLSHIELKYKTDKFQRLQLMFFGGEPLLKINIVKELLSKVKRISDDNEFKLMVHFTTNGTIIPDSLLSFLKEYNVSFQITLDGSKSVHDRSRIYKNNNSLGSYDTIVQNLKRITETLVDYKLNIRVNFNHEIISSLYQLVNDMDFCNRQNTSFSLHKIWQVNNLEIDNEMLFNFINFAKNKNFIVNFMNFDNSLSNCYADNYNQAIINYDGKVFKCTARDFSTSEPEGELLDNGMINWNLEKFLDRMNIRLPKICEECKLLPACPGICSQKILEKGNDVICILNNQFSTNDYIIHNLNKQLLINKLNKLQ